MHKLLILPILLLSLGSFSQENWETTFKAGMNCSFLSKGVSSSGNKIYPGAAAGLEQTYYYQMIQSKNRTITFSVSAPLWNM